MSFLIDSLKTALKLVVGLFLLVAVPAFGLVLIKGLAMFIIALICLPLGLINGNDPIALYEFHMNLATAVGLVTFGMGVGAGWLWRSVSRGSL